MPRVSCMGSESSEELILWTIDHNCQMQESPSKKPDWHLVNSLL